MIEIKTIGVWGFEGSLRGCRMPYESFDKSDSGYGCIDENTKCDNCKGLYAKEYCGAYGFYIGPNDMALCKKLIKGGSEHRKFLRMIHVQADVTAPRYFWQEADKYKWIEANSSSTMHLITKRKLVLDDFSYDDTENGAAYITDFLNESPINTLIERYNDERYHDEKEGIFRTIKILLPESYNQMRTIDTNYECLLSVYYQRKNHRLSEWREFCDFIESLPYMKEFINACS